MPDDTMQPDIALLERAIASASEMLEPGLLSAAECEEIRAEIANLESTIAALNARRVPVQ